MILAVVYVLSIAATVGFTYLGLYVAYRLGVFEVSRMGGPKEKR